MEATTPELGPVGFWSPKSSSFSGSDSIVVEEAARNSYLTTLNYIKHYSGDYWASEASPTLGCSIEISRDIYIYMYICACVCRGPKSVGGITWAKRAHAQSDL